MFLVKNGVPWNEAITMDQEMRVALMIVFGRMDGNDRTFDWASGQWRDAK